jgi:diadenosine tetraphosphate (Ap4A) HIT family hydrolase
MDEAACELCASDGGELLWRDGFLRIVLPVERDYPGFCRVVLNRHVKEMSDLGPADRSRLMNAVFAVERALRDLIQPDKINLASLGNRVPHLHWHVIPRFVSDRHFPEPVWAAPARPSGVVRTVDTEALADRIASSLTS